MKKILIAVLFITLGLFLQAAGDDTPQERYIRRYSALAVEEMHRSGVPASITLAQGLLESGSGLSRLAKEGNNHFGIKCHVGWTGKTMYHDDDAKGECFRVYDSPEESFRDHSDFLRYRDRYKFLFDLERTDYKGWAYGLRRAGYATDPNYPAKLIKYIEQYDLARFDNLTPEEAAAMPAPPHKIEEPVLVSEEYSFAPERTLYSLNDVPFIYASEGETYASIARENHLFKSEVLRYNDLKGDPELLPGTIVYLAPKKNKAPAGLDKYIVETDGEDFHAICQRFAVKEKAIRKLNHLSTPVVLHQLDELKLR
jgi:LysM repeat protein